MQGIFSLSTGYCGTAVNHANSNFPDGAVLVHPPRGPLKSSNSEPDRCNSSRLRKEAERNQDGQFVRQIPGKNKTFLLFKVERMGILRQKFVREISTANLLEEISRKKCFHPQNARALHDLCIVKDCGSCDLCEKSISFHGKLLHISKYV